jgi:endonuclease/exonuclease/phosphatase family metal-dependent hydrolase
MGGVYRVGTFNMLFAAHGDAGFGAPERWERQMQLLRAIGFDVLAVQEASGFDLLGRRRLHRMVADLGMAQGFLATANTTTAGHRFHTAILVSDRIRVLAEGADRTRYHHVLGWADLELPGLAGRLEVRNVHLDPFDPRNRAGEVAPFEVLAAPGRYSVVLGDFNAIGTGFPEPDWTKMPAHLLNGHLGLPGGESAQLADRTAVQLLQRAGFVDAAASTGMAKVATGGFEPGDLPRRQDLILLSPDLAKHAARYAVHEQFLAERVSDHAAVSIEIRTDVAGGT